MMIEQDQIRPGKSAQSLHDRASVLERVIRAQKHEQRNGLEFYSGGEGL